MKRHTIRLYNLIFPIWIFWMVPSLLWLLLPANFLWDSLVLLAAAGWLRLQGKKELWKRSIVKVWLIGFAADFAGAAPVSYTHLQHRRRRSCTSVYHPPQFLEH